MEKKKDIIDSNVKAQEKEILKEKKYLKKNSNSEIKEHKDIEKKINAMLNEVMEDQENGESNNGKSSKSLKFNDDEENTDISQKKQDIFYPNFDRGNKRLKTVDNYPVNFQNFPIMDINSFNLNNNNNFNNMKSPSFGFPNYNNNNLENNNNKNNINNNNAYIGHNSSNNLMPNNMDFSFNNQMYNNNSNAPFIRNSMPYSKTVIYHYPLNLYNMNFNNNLNPMNNNLNYSNYNNNYSNNIQQNNNINQNMNNNKSLFSGNTNLPLKYYKRKESRRRTYPSLNCAFNENAQPKAQNNNNNQILDYNNKMNYNNNNQYNQKSNNEILIFQLKYNLEKTGKIDHYIYNLIKGNFLSIIKSHKGSKIFQKYLKPTHCDIHHQIFLELYNNLEELITDPYANYFCKRFFTYLNQKDRIDFLKKIEKSIVKLSSNSIGTYPIQTIIEHVGSKNEKVIIISAIKDHIKELSIDPFGSHVLEKLLTCFEEEFISFIYDYAYDNFLNLANNNNGICIVKKILSFTHKKTLHDKLKIIVKENALQLIKHPYANFVIQVVIECWSDYKEILDLFDKKYFMLSLEKYASNVVERCIEKDEDILNNYINEIVNSNHIYDVMRSNYGNYVIQKALKLSKGENKNKLVYSAAKDVNKLNDNKLIIKWKSILSPHIKDLSPEEKKNLTEHDFFS